MRKNSSERTLEVAQSIKDIGGWVSYRDVVSHTGLSNTAVLSLWSLMIRRSARWKDEHILEPRTVKGKMGRPTVEYKMIEVDHKSLPRHRVLKQMTRHPNTTVKNISVMTGIGIDTVRRNYNKYKALGVGTQSAGAKRKTVCDNSSLSRAERAEYESAKRFREIWPMRQSVS